MQNLNPRIEQGIEQDAEQTELLPVALFQHVQDTTGHTDVTPDLNSLLHAAGSQEWRYQMANNPAIWLDSLVEEIAQPASPPPPPTIIDLDGPRRLSESMLWKIQEDYYQRLGISAWDSSVPFFITNSTIIAESYAEMIIGFLRDYAPNLDRAEPVYIVEMASGCGRFGFHLLEELSRKLQCFADLRDLKIRMVMTDFTDKNIKFWQSHEKMKPFIDSGMLDFALFWPEQHQSLELWNAGITLSRGQVKNPMIAIANYFFDSIRQDIFNIQSKQLHEGLVSLKRKVEGIDPAKPVDIEEVIVETSARPLYNDNYYDDVRMNAVLRHYRHSVKKGSVIFPLGAFNCLKNLEAMSDDNLVLISSDKAFTTMEDMLGHTEHHYAMHGSFSYMVNYDAIGRYFQNAGGQFFYTTGQNISLQTVCCIGVKQPVTNSRYENIGYQFQEKVDRHNPVNALNNSLLMLTDESMGKGNPPVDGLLAMLRTSLYDPRAFSYVAPWLIQHINAHGLTPGQRLELENSLHQLWDRFYFMNGELSLPFWIGQTHLALGVHDKALFFFNQSEAMFGEHEALCFFMANCHDRMGDTEAAKACLIRSLELNPDMQESKDMLNTF